jgi:glycosyltransferase involved in cell wall biosynthesis
VLETSLTLTKIKIRNDVRKYMSLDRALSPERNTSLNSPPIDSLLHLVRDRPRQFDGRRVAIAGLFKTRCGLRRGAELLMRDFEARGSEVIAVELSEALRRPIDSMFPNLRKPHEIADCGVTDLIIHVNPPEFMDALNQFSPTTLNNASVVGYWVWELPVLSDEWRHCAPHCDALWAPSPFVAKTLFLEIPAFRGEIKVVPYAVERDPMRRLSESEKLVVRNTHNLRNDQFVVGYSFAFSSNYARKNPTAAIDAFRLAFPESENRSSVLLIRCLDARPRNKRLFEHLVGYVGTDDRVRIIDADQHPLPIDEFLGCLDVFLALFRSEGYGLNLIEADQVGVPVLATGWSIAADIVARPGVRTVGYRLVVPLDPQHAYELDGALWAEPDVVEAAKVLQQLKARWQIARGLQPEESSTP